MAQKTTVHLVDDLDGSIGQDVSAVDFSLDGVHYEIDLNAANAANLRDALAKFVATATRVGARQKRAATTARSTAKASVKAAGESRSKEQTKAIRDWAKQNGHTISERGRISDAVVEAFEAAHVTRPRTATFSG